MKPFHIATHAFLCLFVLSLVFSGNMRAQPVAQEQGSSVKLTAGEKTQKIADTRKMREETLVRLYKEKPAVKDEIAKAAGYGVFDGTQINILLFVGATGHGVLMDNRTGKETFMTMMRAGTGPGMGYKTFHQVIVFKSRALFDQFRSVGADVGASGDATARLGGKGASLDGSVSFNPELAVYQLTDSGLLLEANWGGVGYLPDSQLND